MQKIEIYENNAIFTCVMKYETKNLPDSQIEIKFIVPKEDFEKYEEKAWNKMSEKIEIDGFRKGKVPKDIALKNAGEMVLLENMAEEAIADAYTQYLTKEKTDIVGRPSVSITKIGKGSDLEFTLISAVMPEVTLPDYKKIAKKVEVEEIKEATEEELDSLVKELRTARAREDNRIANKDNPENIKNDFTDEELPAFNDEFVKTLGDFTDIADFRTKMKERMTEDKKRVAREKRRMKILEEILKDTKSEVPKILVEFELDKMLGQLEQDIMYSGLSMEEYLKHLQKTKEEIKDEWRDDAKKRALSILALDAISKKENIKEDEEKIEQEAQMLQKMYKDVDPIRAKEYITEVLTQAKVLQFLEDIK